jgi:hypothetical protein
MPSDFVPHWGRFSQDVAPTSSDGTCPSHDQPLVTPGTRGLSCCVRQELGLQDAKTHLGFCKGRVQPKAADVGTKSDAVCPAWPHRRLPQHACLRAKTAHLCSHSQLVGLPALWRLRRISQGPALHGQRPKSLKSLSLQTAGGKGVAWGSPGVGCQQGRTDPAGWTRSG